MKNLLLMILMISIGMLYISIPYTEAKSSKLIENICYKNMWGVEYKPHLENKCRDYWNKKTIEIINSKK